MKSFQEFVEIKVAEAVGPFDTRVNPLAPNSGPQLNNKAITQQAVEILKPIFYKLDNLIQHGRIDKTSFLKAAGPSLNPEQQKDILAAVLTIIANRYGHSQLHALLQ